MFSLEEKIKRLIRKSGPLTFAHFMEMALFDPEDGYYSRGKAAEDYYTSPSAHPAFGALIALQLEQMWEIMDKPREFTVVEMGAGRGLLAEDILDFVCGWSREFYKSLRYIAIERGIQKTGSSPPQADDSKLQKIKSNLIPFRNITGCFLSNELVDSFPVHLIVKQDGKLREIFVGLEDEKLMEVTGELSSDELEKYLAEQGVNMEEGQRVEVNLESLNWLREAGGSLNNGYIITIDYGHEAPLLYSRRFFQGTLLCYHQHNYTDNPYIRMGQQDITSHVNFTALMKEGETLGLSTIALVTQAQFLRNLGLDVFLQALARAGLPQKEYYANQIALRNLASPQGTGDFRVLMQGKDTRDVPLNGVTPDNRALTNLRNKAIPVPLLKPRHLSLLQASYPDYYFQS